MPSVASDRQDESLQTARRQEYLPRKFVDNFFEINDTVIVFPGVHPESLILQSKGRKKPIKEVTLDL